MLKFLVGLFAAYYVAIALLVDVDKTSGTVWFWLGYTILATVICVLYFGLTSRCPKCKKWFAMKEIKREFVDSEFTTVDVERELKNNENKVVGRYNEAVPATRYYYKCVDKCKYCKYRRNVKRQETKRD